MTTRDKHLASSDKRLAPCDKNLATCDKRQAFTLLEVLVALAVLAAGATALGHYAGAFNRISSAEINHADSVLAAVGYLDSLAVSLPPCADTVLTLAETLLARGAHPIVSPIKIRAVYTPIPGPVPLQWLEIRTPDYTFRRLSRCKKASR